MEQTLICHSHKILDQEVIHLFNLNADVDRKLIDLARQPISKRSLASLTKKIDGWQFSLVDPKFMDHSIKDPEKEFLMLSSTAKIDFLFNNQWVIGTPIAVSEQAAARLTSVKEAEQWLKTYCGVVEELF